MQLVALAVLPQPGDEIIYSLRVSNNGTTPITGAVISDTLPVGLSLAGPIGLDPPGAGIPGDTDTLPLLAHQLSLGPNAALTVTYPVLIDPGVVTGTVLVNSAALTSTEMILPVTGSVQVAVGGNRFYMPLIAKGTPP